MNVPGPIPPHGGRLVTRFDDSLVDVLGRPRLAITPRQQADLDLIGVGAFSPLEGFLGALVHNLGLSVRSEVSRELGRESRVDRGRGTAFRALHGGPHQQPHGEHPPGLVPGELGLDDAWVERVGNDTVGPASPLHEPRFATAWASFDVCSTTIRFQRARPSQR